MATQAFQVLHAIPGRIRVKISKLKDDPALAREFQRKLSHIAVVQEAAVSPITGSVLVTYDPEVLESLNSLDLGGTHLMESLHDLLELAELIGIRPEDVDTQSLEDWYRAHATGANPTSVSTAGGTVSAFFGTLNTKVAQASGGWTDLRVLLPLMLFFLGIRSLLATEKVVFPAWYDYLWFAFGTFIALNPLASGKKQAS
jgi:hypothetical protein